MSNQENTLNRRTFVQLGAGAGIAAGALNTFGEEKKPAMKYRELGQTKLKVSEVSLGTYGFNNSGLLEEALDNGINFINTCAVYQHGAAEEAIGKVMKTRRKDAIIFTGWACNPRTKKADLLKSLDDSLKRLNTDHIDIIKTHNIDDPTWLDNDAQYEAFEEAKKAGKVGHLGLSCHGGNIDKVILKALTKKSFEVLQFKYNFMEQTIREQVFAEIKKNKIGVVVFKSQAGKRQNEIKDIEQKGLSHNQATVRWSLADPNIDSVCVTINSFADIREFQEAVMKQFGSAEDAHLKRYAQAVDHEYCRYCSTCESSCPHGVSVADIMRYSMYFKYYKMEKEAIQLYAQVPPEKQVVSCLGCDGPCMAACPHQRQVKDGLIEAGRLLVC